MAYSKFLRSRTRYLLTMLVHIDAANSAIAGTWT